VPLPFVAYNKGNNVVFHSGELGAKGMTEKRGDLWIKEDWRLHIHGTVYVPIVRLCVEG
jgi:hypothetical protein